MPYLEPYHGRDSRHACPACKQQKTFTFYIDGETGRPINPTVGKCNREIKCGYHYTPREYFRDNPKPKRYLTGNLFEQSDTGSSMYNNTGSSMSNNEIRKERENRGNTLVGGQPNQLNQTNKINQTGNLNYVEILQNKIDCISPRYVISSKSYNSNFVEFLHNYFPREKIREAVDNYALGAASYKRVIFWQIDNNDNVRTGKIMQYNPHTGKRVKNEKGGINWVHNLIKKRSAVFEHYNLCQCYFGEHLLNLYPDKPVAIVEAEKTAVIGSMIYSDFIWLAAGNLHGLNSPKSKVLRDRYVLLYPDAGCYEKWKAKLKKISSDVHCTMEISDVVEKHATEQQLEYGYDIADYIIDKIKEENETAETENGCVSRPEHNLDNTFENTPEEKKQPSPTLEKMMSRYPSLTELIEKLGLEECQLQPTTANHGQSRPIAAKCSQIDR
ncbi:MAG TPA: hypothetical protein DEB12_02460 [Porphyromonadaceae bacterium]|nr:hypothetical protein [Porphyromonadaceae bacterium]